MGIVSSCVEKSFLYKKIRQPWEKLLAGAYQVELLLEGKKQLIT